MTKLWKMLAVLLILILVVGAAVGGSWWKEREIRRAVEMEALLRQRQPLYTLTNAPVLVWPNGGMVVNSTPEQWEQLVKIFPERATNTTVNFYP